MEILEREATKDYTVMWEMLEMWEMVKLVKLVSMVNTQVLDCKVSLVKSLAMVTSSLLVSLPCALREWP